MKGRCPVCGSAIALDAAFAAEAAQALLAQLKALGPRAALVLEYVDGFRAQPGKPLREATALRLVCEVRHLIEEGRFEYDGQVYRIELASIDEALKEVATRGMTGLKNHNYLKTVMIGRCSKTRTPMPVKAEGPRGRGGEGARPAPPAPAEGVDVEEIKQFNERFAGIGKPMPDVKE